MTSSDAFAAPEDTVTLVKDLTDARLQGDVQRTTNTVHALCSYIADYELVDSEKFLVYDSTKSLLTTHDVAYYKLGYLLLYNLFRHQNVPQNVRIDAYQYTVSLDTTAHSLRRPALLAEILNDGANIDGLEYTVLEDLMKLAADSYMMTITPELRALSKGQAAGPANEELDTGDTAFRTAYRHCLRLLTDAIKFGPSLGADQVPSVVEQAFRLLANAPATPPQDDLIQLLRIFDALITRAEVTSGSLRSVVYALCRLHDQSSKRGWNDVRQKVGQTFYWILNTHLEDLVLSQLVHAVETGSRGTDDAIQQADGALQLLCMVLADANYESSTKIDLEALIGSFSKPYADVRGVELSGQLRILQLLVEKEHLQQRTVSELDWRCIPTAISALSERITRTDQPHRSPDREALNDILCRFDILPDLTSSQRDILHDLYLTLSPELPHSLADKLLRTYGRPLEASVCIREIKNIKRGFLDSPVVPIDLRLLAADVVQSTCIESQQLDPVEGKFLADLILDAVARNNSEVMLQARLIEHALEYQAQVSTVDDGHFDGMLSVLVKSAQRKGPEESKADRGTTRSQPVTARHIASALVSLYMRNINFSAERSQRLYKIFFDLLEHPSLDSAATVMLLRGLFRMRSDVKHHIFLLASPEGESLAIVLDRSTRGLQDDFRRPSKRLTVTDSGMVWMYGEVKGLSEDPPKTVSAILHTRRLPYSEKDGVIDVVPWLKHVIRIIEHGADWEIFSYVIVHLSPQLANQSLFTEAIAQIRQLRGLICHLILKQSFQRPPDTSELKQADVAVCLYHILTTLIGYHVHFSRSETEDMISAFIMGMTAWDRTTVPCIHALTLCCYELPDALKRDLARIVGQMSTIVTKSDAAVHVLEFLAGLSRLKDLARTFHGEEMKTVFGVCFSYIEYVRGKRFDEAQQRRRSVPSTRAVSASAESANVRSLADDLPHYVFALAYHVITFWYTSLRKDDRDKYFSWMQRRLLSTDQAGRQEEQALVTLDFIWRITKRNITSTSLARPEPATDTTAAWISPSSLVYVSPNYERQSFTITERRASGTDEWHVSAQGAATPEAVFAAHMSSAVDRPFPDAWNPSPLIQNDNASRAINMLDRISPVDFFKAGVLYVGEGQPTESEVLANLMGSDDYRLMLEGLGSWIALRGLQHNTCGLDTSEALTDGPKALWHRDEVTALIYHVSTKMPTDLRIDPQCTHKKAHIGNDHVNIVFNNSGGVFDFATLNDLLPSAFNYVYVVVSPEARATFIETRTRHRTEGHRAWFDSAWFRVQVLTRTDFPNISSAAETKVVSGAVLATYVRNLTLNACIFANVWRHREGGESPSSWRARLQQLRMLKERFGSKEGEMGKQGEDAKK